MNDLEIVKRAGQQADRIAIVEERGRFLYRDLLERSDLIARAVSAMVPDSPDARVTYLIAPGFDHVAVQWGIWRAGAIAVPLSGAQAPAEWAYVIGDAGAALVIADAASAEPMRQAIAGTRAAVVTIGQLLPSGFHGAGTPRTSDPPSRLALRRTSGALILYTSGTTGKPKGVVLTHANIEAQVRSLVAAWEWRRDDRILHVLPLHHVHGIVNVLTCALWAGATCEMAPQRGCRVGGPAKETSFDADAVWNVIATGRLTLFMAVPTIYSKLIAAWERADGERRRAMSNGCRAMRLMVSGSAALPVSVLERWREISGHVLLERYGMTEIGMALSNPLEGERRPGFVGTPLPGVEVRIVDEQGREVETGVAGELMVRGPGVFHEYWQRPEATAAAFREGWFRTGDVAVFENGMYRLLGRQSVDIIKCGGYKVSALEIEEVLCEHPAIGECAVVGIEDAEWGERIAVAAVARGDVGIELEPLRDWARARLARYKLPTRLLVVSDLPRNAMGKVSKPAVKDLFK